MRRAGVLACSSVRISFSRNRAAVLWMRTFAGVPEFSMTTPLTISRSLGFRLMVSGILRLSWFARPVYGNAVSIALKREAGGREAARHAFNA
jgi:hypothetical protein